MPRNEPAGRHRKADSVKLRRRYMTGRSAANVDVTAFLSLMVILVPFLLITAVFSRITILELQSAGSDAPPERDPLQLVVVVREQVVEVAHAGQAEAVLLTRTPDGAEIPALASLMADLKSRFPGSREATILLEPQVEYDMLVQVMDAVRIQQVRRDDGMEHLELFPLITLGEAAP